MADITFGLDTTVAPRPRRQNFLVHFFHAVQAARMRQAEREIERYRHLLPNELERAAADVGPRTEDNLPFIR